MNKIFRRDDITDDATTCAPGPRAELLADVRDMWKHPPGKQRIRQDAADLLAESPRERLAAELREAWRGGKL